MSHPDTGRFRSLLLAASQGPDKSRLVRPAAGAVELRRNFDSVAAERVRVFRKCLGRFGHQLMSKKGPAPGLAKGYRGA